MSTTASRSTTERGGRPARPAGAANIQIAALSEEQARAERNRALRVARARASAGDEAAAAVWWALAKLFAEPTDSQVRAHERAILRGRQGVIHPGQLRLPPAA